MADDLVKHDGASANLLNGMIDAVAEAYDSSAAIQIAYALAATIVPIFVLPHITWTQRAKAVAARRSVAFAEAITRELDGKVSAEYLKSEHFIDSVRAGLTAALATETDSKIRMYAKIIRGEATGLFDAGISASMLITALAEITLEELWIVRRLLEFQGGAGYDHFAETSSVPQTGELLKEIGTTLGTMHLPFHLQRLMRVGFVGYASGYGGSWYYATGSFADAARLCDEIEREDATATRNTTSASAASRPT